MPAVGKAMAVAAQAQPGPVRGPQEDSESSEEESDSDEEAPTQVRPGEGREQPCAVSLAPSLILFLSLQAKPSGKTPQVTTISAPSKGLARKGAAAGTPRMSGAGATPAGKPEEDSESSSEEESDSEEEKEEAPAQVRPNEEAATMPVL